MEKVLQGLGVSHGKVQARVNIIRDTSEQNKFKQGDILVTRITNPKMVMLMGKASGIICDIGGMTSHPSIVSREMGIPCIVSAKCIKTGKHATEVLKDRMLVSMDGQTGEIHLLEKGSVWIDDFLDAVGDGFAGMDMTTFEPIDCFDIFPLYAKQGVARVLSIIDKTKNHKAIDLAKNMHSPSVLRAEMILAPVKARLADVEHETFVKIIEFYNSLLNSVCLTDPYAKNGKNIIHTKDQIKQFINGLKQANPEIAKVLGKLSNSCYNLSYGLYSDINPQICYETFGPYDVSKEFGNGCIFVIKQFKNLRPVEFLGDKIKDLPYNRIRIYCVYENVSFSIDAATHIIFMGDVINGLKHFAVEIDGKITSNLSEIKKATEIIGLKAIDMWDELTGLDFEQAKKRYLEQRCYNHINLCNFLGLDWKPTKEMLEAVENKELVKDFWPKFNSPDDEVEFWKQMVDPRIQTKQLKKYWEK